MAKKLEIEDIYTIQEEIEKSKITKARLEGEIKSIMTELKEKWNCNTLKEAEKVQAKLEKEIERLDEEIESGLLEVENELAENYDDAT